MSASFYRTVIPASCIMITRMVDTISRFISQPSTSLIFRPTPKSLVPSPSDSSKGTATIGSLYLRSLLPGLHSGFHPAMKLFEKLREDASSTQSSSSSDIPAPVRLISAPSYGSLYLTAFQRSRFPALHRDTVWGFHPAMKLIEKYHETSSTITQTSSPTPDSAPSDGSLKITVPKGTKQSMIESYRQMELQLQSLHSDNALTTITKLSLSVPYKLSPQHFPPDIPSGPITTIPTPNLRKFEWRGKLENLPAPWYGLTQFEFSELETLVLRNCKISVEDCLFILQKAPKLKRFAIHEISDVPSTTKGPQGQNLSFPALQHLRVACGDADLTRFWEVVGKSCENLDTLIIKSGTPYQMKTNINSIPWDLEHLRDVKFKKLTKTLKKDIELKDCFTNLTITVDYQ